jgi:hypothetical protein
LIDTDSMGSMTNARQSDRADILRCPTAQMSRATER